MIASRLDLRKYIGVVYIECKTVQKTEISNNTKTFGSVLKLLEQAIEFDLHLHVYCTVGNGMRPSVGFGHYSYVYKLHPA